MTTTREMSLAEVIASLAQMERACPNPVAIGMNPAQWSRCVNEVLFRCGLFTLPDAMRPAGQGELGRLHGLPVLPMAADGVALFSA